METEAEMESLRKLVSLKSKMALNHNHQYTIQGSLSRRAKQGPVVQMHESPSLVEDEKDIGSENRILDLESKVRELSYKAPLQPPSTSILSDVNEVGGLVRMWGENYTAREKHLSRHLHTRPGPDGGSSGNGKEKNGITSLLDKSAQRILSIRTSASSRQKSKSGDVPIPAPSVEQSDKDDDIVIDIDD